MKKIIWLFIFLPFISVAQYSGKLVIYTTLPDAAFIPYINDEKQTMVPVDTFEIELNNVEEIEVFIDFADSTVYDIRFKTNFRNLKLRKYQIVYKENKKGFGAFIKKLFTPSDIVNTNYNKKLENKFTLKDESAKEYLNKVNE